jgi:hypothetical protein
MAVNFFFRNAGNYKPNVTASYSRRIRASNMLCAVYDGYNVCYIGWQMLASTAVAWLHGTHLYHLFTDLETWLGACAVTSSCVLPLSWDNIAVPCILLCHSSFNTSGKYKKPNVVPTLHEPRHESGGIAPLIYNLGTRWRWVVRLTCPDRFTQRNNPGTHWIWGWVGHRAGLDVSDKINISRPCPVSNPCLCSLYRVSYRDPAFTVISIYYYYYYYYWR